MSHIVLLEIPLKIAGSMCVKFPFVFYSKAKLMLRKKKFQESLIEKTDGQLENIERMVCLLPLKKK